MKTGLAKVDITPALPCRLCGYASLRTAEKVHNPLYAKIVVLQPEASAAITFVLLDVIGFDQTLTDEVRKRMPETGLDSQRIFIIATHTHTGPGGLIQTETGLLAGTQDLFGKPDRQYSSLTAERIIEGILQAQKNLSPAKISYARGELKYAGNRNNPALKGDDSLRLLQIENKTDKVLILQSACHPTTLSDAFTEISADFPGWLDQKFTEDGFLFTGWINGACGDISTRYTRTQRGLPDTRRVGDLLYKKAVEMQEQLQDLTAVIDHPDAIGPVSTISIPMQLKTDTDFQTAEKLLEKAQSRLEQAQEQASRQNQVLELHKKRQLESAVEAAWAKLACTKNALLRTKAKGISQHNLSLQILNILNQPVVLYPGELFSELAALMPEVLFIGYAGGYQGYLADLAAYDNQTYEALASPFEKGEGEKLMETLKGILYEKR